MYHTSPSQSSEKQGHESIIGSTWSLASRHHPWPSVNALKQKERFAQVNKKIFNLHMRYVSRNLVFSDCCSWQYAWLHFQNSVKISPLQHYSQSKWIYFFKKKNQYEICKPKFSIFRLKVKNVVDGSMPAWYSISKFLFFLFPHSVRK